MLQQVEDPAPLFLGVVCVCRPKSKSLCLSSLMRCASVFHAEAGSDALASRSTATRRRRRCSTGRPRQCCSNPVFVQDCQVTLSSLGFPVPVTRHFGHRVRRSLAFDSSPLARSQTQKVFVLTMASGSSPRSDNFRPGPPPQSLVGLLCAGSLSLLTKDTPPSCSTRN